MDETAKRDIKGILLSVGKPCTLRELSKLYLEQIGQPIDFRKYGYTSLEKCLSGTTDICKLQYFGGECYVDRVLTANSKHLDTMTKAIKKRSVVQRKRFTPNMCAPPPTKSYIQNRFFQQPIMNYQYQQPMNYQLLQLMNNQNRQPIYPLMQFSVGHPINFANNQNNRNFSQHPNSNQQKFIPNKPALKHRTLVSNNIKPSNKPAVIASRRDVPTVVFKNTVDNDENTSSTVNVEKEIKSTEKINMESIPSALITSALKDLKIQKKQDIKKYDNPRETSSKLDGEPKKTSLKEMKEPKLSEIDKVISTLLPDDPIYLIEFPEIIQDCTYKIPSPIFRKTKADLHFELYISEVHSPTQFWFQYGEEDLEELMNYMKDFYCELRKDDLSISAKNAKPGLIVAAFLFSKWQRAEILEEVDENNQLLVFFFDYGTKEKIGLKNVKYLLATFSKISRKALRGCLHGIKPKDGDATWKIKTSLFLLGKIEDKRMFAKVVNHRKEDDVLELIVKEKMSDHYSLSEILIEEGYADPAPSSKMINDVLLHSIGPKCSYYPSYEMLERRYYPSLTKRIFLELEGIDLNLLEELNYFQNLTSSASFIYNPTIMELLNHTKFKFIKNFLFPSEN